MMVSPQGFIHEFEDEPYTQLLKERDKLVREIRHFEKHREEIMNSDEYCICPSPDLVYQMNLEYLGSLCLLISKKINEEFE